MKKPKLKLPLSIEKVESSSYNYYFSEQKVFLMVVFLFLAIAWNFLCLKFLPAFGMPMGSAFFVGILIAAAAAFYFFRHIIFEEGRQRQLMSNLQEERISPYSKFWHIARIDDDGLLHFKYRFGTYKAYVVKITAGSTNGRPADFINIYQTALTDFVNALMREGYSFRNYNVEESQELPDNLKYMMEKANAVRDPLRRRLSVAKVDNIIHQVKTNTRIEVDYYVVYCTDLRKHRTFLQDLTLIHERHLHSTYFKNKRILTKNEVKDFFSRVLQVKAFPYVEEEILVPFPEYGEIVRAYDHSGLELLLDEELRDLTDDEKPDHYQGEPVEEPPAVPQTAAPDLIALAEAQAAPPDLVAVLKSRKPEADKDHD